MTNTLTFSTVYKSLTQLESVSLPNFVVLTGRNGSGKTHLLEAILGGQVRSSLVSDPKAEVRIFNSTTIIPTDTGLFDPAQEQSRKSQWFSIMSSRRSESFQVLQNFAIQQGVPFEYCSSVQKIASLDAAKLSEIIQQPERAVEIEAALRQHLKALGTRVFNESHGQIGDDYWRRATPKIQQLRPESFLIDSQSRFFEQDEFLWGEVDPFQQAFGRVFTSYRELIHANDRLGKYPPTDDPTRRMLSAIEFVKAFGPTPWDFVNQILEECRLDFRVNAPPLHEIASYEPKLRKLSADVEMKFQDLSSGEKVLMSFALCIYNSQESRQFKIFPKLLLLDEVDAPLHPSMAASLLKTIQNVLVRDKGVSVILTTHSPSTVALAPEEAIFVMNPVGPRVEKVSRSSALAILTHGVPTLAISFDGRRQIFVESRTDADLYDLLYQSYKGHFSTERSIVFVEVGKKNESGNETNAGCDQVIRLVNSLAEGGNQTVLGLLDWDGKRTPESRVHVLSPGIRDGLESLLFDPKLLIAAVARDGLDFGKERGFFDIGETYTLLSSWDTNRWQRAVNAVQVIVLGTAIDSSTTVPVCYLNGITLNISKSYLHLDDHKLEAAVVQAFKFLRPKNARAGGLMRHIAGTVLADFPNFLPKDFLITVEGLMSVDL
jgi:ABC-type branched-subunit amino acid transport system ATPase component